MNCPACKIKLQRVQYEGLNIRRCDRCQGHLVKSSRLKAIQARRHQTEEDLLQEVIDEGDDSLGKLKCPQCWQTMEKRRKRIGTLEFFVDRCCKCELVWLDAGELAKSQLIFEFSDKGQEAERFRNRLRNMSAQDKAALDGRIANLPEVSISQEVVIGLLTEFRFGRGGSPWRF